MDFFQNQENAQRKTGLLVFYYILAVVLIILGIYTAFILVFQAAASSELEIESMRFWNPHIFFLICGITLAIVAIGTLFKVNQLSAGGKSVAKLLGGKPVHPETRNSKERMFLNIVEEMAIASGSQVPAVYILEQEKGINAFAAGFTPDDAAIGITRGCLEKLSRDQLQGVVAHEFSHILHGDMRINIKLMGVLHGILIIAFLGYAVLRSMLYAPRRRSSGKGGNPLPLILFGLALIIIGSIGVFFGNLIKSAVSRQREYLADASAVQFTRNPSGIAGALKKIAGIADGSRLESKHAQEANHLFFSQSLSGFMANLMSSHPPIEERIQKLESSFKKTKKSEPAATKQNLKTAGFAGSSQKSPKFNVESQEVLSSVGTARPEHISYASQILKDISQAVLDNAHSLPEAEVIIYSLLFSKEIQAKEKQISLLKEKIPPQAFKALQNISPEIQKLPVEYRLPLIDIAISTLKKSSAEKYRQFKNNIQKMIEADGKVSLFEYTVKKIILRHLEPAFRKPSPPPVKYHSLKKLKYESSLLLSYLAHYGLDESQKKAAAFAKAAAEISIIDSSDFLATEKCSLKKLDEAFDKLDKASPKLKKKIIAACVTCVIADGWITKKQAELIRVTADAISCPLPPLSPGKA